MRVTGPAPSTIPHSFVLPAEPHARGCGRATLTLTALLDLSVMQVKLDGHDLRAIDRRKRRRANHRLSRRLVQPGVSGVDHLQVLRPSICANAKAQRHRSLDAAPTGQFWIMSMRCDLLKNPGPQIGPRRRAGRRGPGLRGRTGGPRWAVEPACRWQGSWSGLTPFAWQHLCWQRRSRTRGRGSHSRRRSRLARPPCRQRTARRERGPRPIRGS